VSLSAAALKDTNAADERLEELWMARASSVLPVPDSPRISTGSSVCAAARARSRQRRIGVQKALGHNPVPVLPSNTFT